MWQDLYTHSISAGNFFFQAWKLFSTEIWKMLECHFWANVMLRQSRPWAARASPAQKPQGLRVVCSKNFSRATFFCFLGHFVADSFLSYLPVKQIWRKSAVWQSAKRIRSGKLEELVLDLHGVLAMSWMHVRVANVVADHNDLLTQWRPIKMS